MSWIKFCGTLDQSSLNSRKMWPSWDNWNKWDSYTDHIFTENLCWKLCNLWGFCCTKAWESLMLLVMSCKSEFHLWTECLAEFAATLSQECTTANVIPQEMVLYSLEVTVMQKLPTCVRTIPISPHTHTRNQLFSAVNKRLRWSSGTRVRGFEPGRSRWIFWVSE